MSTTRRNFLKITGGTTATLITSGHLSTAKNFAKKPNIVLMMADDMGYSDIGCYGSEIDTPNLDKLAENGLRFTQFYNGARCCPTRAALLTGLYAHQTGLGLMEPDLEIDGYRGRINQNCITIAEVLKLAGYRTYMSGKWHLSGKEKSDAPPGYEESWPCHRGFDRFFGTIAGAGSFFDPKTLTRDNESIEAPEGFYYTDAISDNAAKFIMEHAKDAVAKPFFLYVAYTAPHWPLHALKKDIDKYEGLYMKGWDVLRTERHKRMIKMGIVDKKWKLSSRDSNSEPWDQVEKAVLPKVIKDIPEIREKLRKIMAHKMAVYAAQIDSMDQGVDRIVSALKKTGRLENTLILFLADNGACSEYGKFGFGWKTYKKGKIAGEKDSWSSYGLCWANAGNTPFRYFKHFAHEGGIATPLIAHWPVRIKDKGKLRHQAGHIIDIMATCMDISGTQYPEKYNGHKIKPLEGKSLVSAFDNKPLKREYLCWEHHGNRAIRAGDWKLVAHAEKGPWELYNMAEDRTETNDLSEKKPEMVKKLDTMWQAWAKRANVLPMNPHKILKAKKQKEKKEKSKKKDREKGAKKKKSK